MLLEVSLRLTNKVHVRKLGFELQVAEHNITTMLEQNDINNAAYQVLKLWFENEEDKKAAYQVLRKALVDVKLTSIAYNVLNY